MAEPVWTQMDVEVAAQAACDGLIPPLELMMRLGQNPPSEYLESLGARVVEMATARAALIAQLVAHLDRAHHDPDVAMIEDVLDVLGPVAADQEDALSVAMSRAGLCRCDERAGVHDLHLLEAP